MGRIRDQMDWTAGEAVRAFGEVILDEKNTDAESYAKSMKARFPNKSFTKSSVIGAYRRHFFRFSSQFTKEEVDAIRSRYETNAVRNKKSQSPKSRKARVRREPVVRKPPPKAPATAKTEVVETVAVDLQPLRAPDGARYTLTNIEEGMCQWPYSDPDKPDFALCGRAAKAIYCEEHQKQARGKATPRKRSGPARLASELQQIHQRDRWK